MKNINDLVSIRYKLYQGGRLKKMIARILSKYIRIRFQCDIQASCNLDGVFLCHQGFGIVINGNAKIGKGTYIQHGVTIGVNEETHEAPIIGEHVRIGARAIIIGNVKIGDYAIIGAGAVVVKDIPTNTTAVGVPAKVIKTNNHFIDLYPKC